MSEKSRFPITISEEALTFREKAFLAILPSVVNIETTEKGRAVSCDLLSAWDIAKAADEWRKKMGTRA